MASVFSPPPIISFSYDVEIFSHPLVQLIRHVIVLIGYKEMYIYHYICSFEGFSLSPHEKEELANIFVMVYIHED